MNKLYQEFLSVTKVLNSRGITPVLYGSLGLGMLLKKDLKPSDVDILVPKIFLKSKWSFLKGVVEDMGYELIDLHEHEFSKKDFRLAFGEEEDLEPFSGVNYKTLKIVTHNGSRFKELGANDYLLAYSSALKDSYRQNKKQVKDMEKIRLIKEYLKKSKI